MIAIKHDGALEIVSPATWQEIEHAITDGLNKRVEVMKVTELAERLVQLKAETEKIRIQKLEWEIPTNAA